MEIYHLCAKHVTKLAHDLLVPCVILQTNLRLNLYNVQRHDAYNNVAVLAAYSTHSSIHQYNTFTMDTMRIQLCLERYNGTVVWLHFKEWCK